jgi:hypothetical protein
MKIFYKIIDGKMRVKENSDDNANASDGWKETENAELYKYDGEPVEWFDENMHRIPDDELVKQGKRIDKRGRWFNKETREQKQIYNLDEPIDESQYTQAAPIENESYQLFDKKKNKWVIDEKNKERVEKQNELAQLKAEIAEAERKQIRPLKEIARGKATDKDHEVFMENENLIQSLRPSVAELEAELKTA